MFFQKHSEISSWAQLISNFDAQKSNFVLNCMELCSNYVHKHAFKYFRHHETIFNHIQRDHNISITDCFLLFYCIVQDLSRCKYFSKVLLQSSYFTHNILTTNRIIELIFEKCLNQWSSFLKVCFIILILLFALEQKLETCLSNFN